MSYALDDNFPDIIYVGNQPLLQHLDKGVLFQLGRDIYQQLDGIFVKGAVALDRVGG